jgi:hypothetical protein
MSVPDRDPAHLNPVMRQAVEQLLSIRPMTIVETLRSYQRQTEMLKTGKSKTLHSRHLTGMGCDVMPPGGYSAYKDADWQALHDEWDAIVIALGREPEKRIAWDLGHIGMMDAK